MRTIIRRRPPRRSRNRTRVLFYVFIAIILAVIALSLSMRIIDSAFLRQIYIVASILAIGVVVLDMLGFLGSHQHDEGAAYEDGGDDGGDGGSADHSFAGDGSDAYGAGQDFGSDDGGDGGDGEAASEGIHDGMHVDDMSDWASHEGPVFAGGSVLEAIRYLRMFIYFCLGFGVVGFATLAAGRTPQASLLIAGIAGISSVLVARTFYRLQPQDTGDVVSEDDLLLEQGTVLVPLSDETMGRIRVQLGMEVYEPFAKAAQAGTTFARGDAVKIVKVTDDCVYVGRA
ncbi:MAG: hypothetical protein ACK2UO_11300 [Caldilineaceae bacterium]